VKEGAKPCVQRRLAHEARRPDPKAMSSCFIAGGYSVE
jgi:hypothetical protein